MFPRCRPGRRYKGGPPPFFPGEEGYQSGSLGYMRDTALEKHKNDFPPRWRRTPVVRRGFTFTEMILVISVISVLGLALYQSISHGLRIWERTQRFLLEEDVAIFFDRITRDLHNAFNYSLLFFEGEEDRIAFATIVRVPVDRKIRPAGDAYTDQIGRVEYYCDGLQSILYRRVANYSQALEGTFGKARLIARPVASLKFYYYVRDEEAVEVKTQIEEVLPLAVRVEVEFLDPDGRLRKAKRVINIPAGGHR